MKKQSFFDIPIANLKQVFVNLGFQGFVAKQCLDWVYKKHIYDVGKMTNISKANKDLLNEKFDFSMFQNVKSVHSKEDNAIKNICELDDNNFIECVILNQDNYYTLCISSQCGCAVDCKFCLTGVIGFKRQLTVAEIIKQVVYCYSVDYPIKNIVFMGMGEPLMNYKNVLAAIDYLTDIHTYNLSQRSITVSTAGYLAGVKQLIKDERYLNLAFSVGSADPLKRIEFMPIEKRNPIVEFVKILHNYQKLHNRKTTLEYTLLEGINDSDYDIRSLINF
tara:strand:- start:225 stop:1055 length:831 start_codon:yes stop_codon:yes gene_type:complete